MVVVHFLAKFNWVVVFFVLFISRFSILWTTAVDNQYFLDGNVLFRATLSVLCHEMDYTETELAL